MSEYLLSTIIERSFDSPEHHFTADDLDAIKAAWHSLRHERVGLEGGQRSERLEFCRRAISSGRFHAIVLSDLSEDERAVPELEQALGSTLQTFVRGGGPIAITSAEPARALPTLRRLFDVDWNQGGRNRATWGPVRGNATRVEAAFPGTLATRSFNVTASAVCNVPRRERMYGAVTGSSKQRTLNDVVVAMHAYGEGSIALFCDVNMEAVTVQLVLGYCREKSAVASPRREKPLFFFSQGKYSPMLLRY